MTDDPRCALISRDAGLLSAVERVAGSLVGLRFVGAVDLRIALAGAIAADLWLVSDEPGQPAADTVRQLARARPGIPAVVVATDPSLDSYRGALAAGARGLVTVPVDPAELAATAHAALEARSEGRRALPAGTLVAVCGASGGAGATSVALALAASADGTVIDLACSYQNLAALLGCRPERSLSDLLGTGGAAADGLRALAVRHPSGLRLVPGLAKPALHELLDSDAVAALARAAHDLEGITVIDIGVPVRPAALELAAACDRVVLVATPEPPSVLAAGPVLEALAERGADPGRVGLVVNRWSRGRELSLRAIARVTGAPVVAALRDARGRAGDPFVSPRVDPLLDWVRA
jgi:pilus assembly protein CpaE